MLARAVDLDMVRAGWKPSVDNYLGRVTKPRILEAVREAKGESSAQLIDHLKKVDIAKEAERLLDGSGWLPEPLRLVDPDAASGEQESEAGPLPEFLSLRAAATLTSTAVRAAHETVEQSYILKPAAIIVLKQIPQNTATSLFGSIQPDELHAAVRRAYGIFREHSPDLIALIIAGSADILPDLLLARVIRRDREGHELLESHTVFGIDIVQLWRHGRQPESLLHDSRRHEMPSRDILLGHAGATQGLKGSELIERMKPYPLVILCERVVFSDATLAHDARRTKASRHAGLSGERLAPVMVTRRPPSQSRAKAEAT